MKRKRGLPLRTMRLAWTSVLYAALGVVSSNSFALYNIFSEADIPDNAFPALYYWSLNSSQGFGASSSSYPSGHHPGYIRRTNYSLDLASATGFLADHPSALKTIFAESEAAAVESDGYWQDIIAVYRTSPFKVDAAVAKFPASWDADVWYRSSDTVEFKVGYAWWGSSLYSGRACPYNHDAYILFKEDLTVTEVYCSLPAGKPDVEAILGDPGAFCPIKNGVPSIGVANPINLATGNKFQSEGVVASTGNTPLRFELSYNSQALVANAREKWTHTYFRSLSNVLQVSLDNIDDMLAVPQSVNLSLRAKRPDGQIIRFHNVMDWTAKTTVSAQWLGSAGNAEQLYSVNDPSSGEITGLELLNSDGEIEHYALDGRLVALTTRDGRQLTLTHTNEQRVSTITDEAGRQLMLGYTGASLTSLTFPTGEVVAFNYDPSGNLAQIVYPDDTPADDTDNPSRTYQYEDTRFPSYLTGITDERGIRVATWTYDDQGRAISSEHAGGTDHYGLVYNADGSTTVTDPQGRERTYRFVTQHGLIKVASVTGGDCSSCGQDGASYNYDANGFLASKTDFNGNVTTYTRDARGRELTRTEAAGTPEARTITTTWHPDFNKLLTVTEPGRITTYTYDTAGRQLSAAIQSLP